MIDYQIVNKNFDWGDVTHESFERFIAFVGFVFF